MYCRNCGKYIESGELCNECLSEVVVFGGEVKRRSYAEEVKRTRKTGLRKAIVGTVLSVISVILGSGTTTFGSLLVAVSKAEPEIGTGFAIPLGAGAIGALALCGIGALVLAVFGAIFGAISLRVAFETKRNAGRLPIATMILGFVSVACVVATLFLLFYAVLGVALYFVVSAA